MTLYIIISTCYVKNEIKRLRNTTRMEEHANILATNLMKEIKTIRRLKKNYKTYVSNRIIIYRAYATDIRSSRLS